MSLGDFAPGTTFYVPFTSRDTTGVPGALTSGAVACYKDNNTTEVTTGLTLSASFDGRSGANLVAVDTSDAFYASGSVFWLILTAGTVNGISVVNEVIGYFTLNKTSALRPTTAGRTLDVSAGGEAGVDWANVGGQSTSVTLTNTSISGVVLTLTTNAVTSISAGGITAASFAAGAIDAAAIADNAIDAGAIASNAITAAKIASNAITSSQLATDCIGAAQIAANAITTSELADGAITAAKIATGAVDADALATDAVNEITAATDSVLTAAHGAGSWAGGGGPTNVTTQIYVLTTGATIS